MTKHIERPKYQAAHMRIQAQRGKASQHECVNCGGQAAEWSTTTHTLHDVINHGRTVVGYSPDVNDYVPLCRSCHRTWDRIVKNQFREYGLGVTKPKAPKNTAAQCQVIGCQDFVAHAFAKLCIVHMAMSEEAGNK